MRCLYALFLFCILLVLSTKAQNVYQVEYDGFLTKPIEMKFFVDSVEAESFVESEMARFSKMGFESAMTVVKSDKSDTLFYVILPGIQYYYVAKSIKSVDSLGFQMPQKWMNPIYEPSIFDVFRQKMDKFLSFYEDRGYPFAAMKVDSLAVRDGVVFADFEFDKGNLYKFDSIVLRGDVKISDAFLRNFFGLKRKGVYSEKRLRQSMLLARQLSFMTMTESPQVLFVEERALVFMSLKKRKNHSFDGLVGFVPPPDGSSGIRLTGDVKVKLNNLFAQGEYVGFDWRSYDMGSQDLNIDFNYPFLFSSAFGTQVNFKLNKRDTTFLNTHYNLGVNYYLSGFDYLKGFYESTVSNTFSGINQADNSSYRSSKLSSYGIEFYKNRLNDVLLPTSGYYFKTSLSAGTLLRDKIKKQGDVGADKLNQYRFVVDVPYYVPIYKRFIFHTSLNGVWTVSESLYSNEMLRFGGFNSLKGFDEDGISASTFFMNTIEFRYMLEQFSYFSLFWNGAFYERNGVESYVRDAPWGLGLGFAFNTPAGIFSINYAMGKQFDNPFDIKGAKVHFGISGKF
jgi:outer membrane protein assembly factor BamA